MPYVDGFVIPIPKKNLAAYRKMARAAGRIWMDHGALEYRECAGDDLTVADPLSGRKVPLFPKMAKIKRGETVVFSWIVYRSKAHRDQVLKKVMADPRMQKMMDPAKMPFDGKRMAYGGFKTFVDM